MKQYQEHGFTLVEIISVLVIIGILSAVALPDFFNIQERIRSKMIDNVISDLNHREYLIWATHFESEEDHDDGIIFNRVNPENIGAKFIWSDGPSTNGGTITFGPTVVGVTRTLSKPEESGYWVRENDEGSTNSSETDTNGQGNNNNQGQGNQGQGNQGQGNQGQGNQGQGNQG